MYSQFTCGVATLALALLTSSSGPDQRGQGKVPNQPNLPPITVSGTLFNDGGGGPLRSDRVYHVVGNITVPAAETLTVQRGAILKFTSGVQVTVNGRLRVAGTKGKRVYFTSYLDDSRGGDTFGDGPTVGMPGDWRGIRPMVGGSIDITFADLAFGGTGGFSLIQGGGGAITLRDSRIRQCSFPGVNLNFLNVPTVIERCAINKNNGWAIDKARINSVPSFLDNTATGNSLGDAVFVSASILTGDATIAPENLIGGALVISGAPTIPVGVTLTLEAGTGIKFDEFMGGQFIVDGALVTNGTASEQVVITSLRDDDYFGDTENDGPTAGAPSDIRGVYSRAGSTDLEYTLVRYGGSGGWNCIEAGPGSLSLESCTISDGTGPGIALNSRNEPTVIQNCTIENNTGWAIDGARIEQVASFSNNTATGNTLGDAVRATASVQTVDTTLAPLNLIGGALVIIGAPTIPAGLTLTLEAGTGIKFSEFTGGQFIVDGTFVCNGTAAEQVVITSLRDDDHFGDTANDGLTAGGAGDIRGVYTRAGSTDMESTIVRYGGSGGWNGIEAGLGSLSLESCTISDGQFEGIALNNRDVDTVIIDCDIDNNTGVAVTGALLSRMSGFDSNRALGNAGGDYIEMGGQTSLGDATIGPRNLINGALVSSAFAIAAADTLTLLPGTIIKFKTGLVVATGALRIEGTGSDPVVLTSFEDDDYAGDTNGDGVSSGARGDWFGVNLQSTALPSSLEHTLVRYSGAGGWDGIRCTTFLLDAFDSLRVEHSQFVGFRLTGLPIDATNLVSYENGGIGILLQTGFFDLVHATVANNDGGGGIQAVTNFNGVVRNTVCWGQQPNYFGLNAGEMMDSNGDPFFAGIDGNLNVDPQFVDSANGDLHLAPGSPVVDAADFSTASAAVSDYSENSRLVRTFNTGSLEADMGAYEQVLWSMSASGSAAIGESITLQVDGRPGTASYTFGLLDGTLLVSPLGFQLNGVASVMPLAPSLAVGVPKLIPIPNDPLMIGLELGFQALAVDAVDANLTHLTNMKRIVVEPALP